MLCEGGKCGEDDDDDDMSGLMMKRVCVLCGGTERKGKKMQISKIQRQRKKRRREKERERRLLHLGERGGT